MNEPIYNDTTRARKTKHIFITFVVAETKKKEAYRMKIQPSPITHNHWQVLDLNVASTVRQEFRMSALI